uniref:Ubiquitin-like domain-containing protein n=1 Tax=Oryzias sinensis TaxID=183150 RepID=A0A8C7XCI7_9TELE
MELEIFSGCDKFLQKMENDDALLGSYPVDDNCLNQHLAPIPSVHTETRR